MQQLQLVQLVQQGFPPNRQMDHLFLFETHFWTFGWEAVASLKMDDVADVAVVYQMKYCPLYAAAAAAVAVEAWYDVVDEAWQAAVAVAAPMSHMLGGTIHPAHCNCPTTKPPSDAERPQHEHSQQMTIEIEPLDH